MRRTVTVLATATPLALGAGLAAPAAAGPPSETLDVNCRPGTMCHYEKTGWWEPPGRRNVGG